MASLRRSIDIAVSAGPAWDAVRIVTFANGMSLRELLVGVEDEERRLVWSAQSDAWHHHNASLQVMDLGNGQSRTTWVADVLPDEAGAMIATIMEMGLGAMKVHLEGPAN
jgi:hypothetical protein